VYMVNTDAVYAVNTIAALQLAEACSLGWMPRTVSSSLGHLDFLPDFPSRTCLAVILANPSRIPLLVNTASGQRMFAARLIRSESSVLSRTFIWIVRLPFCAISYLSLGL